MAATVAKVEVFPGADGKWYFHTKARNGRVLDRSQGYTRKWTAKTGAKRAYPGVPVVVVDPVIVKA